MSLTLQRCISSHAQRVLKVHRKCPAVGDLLLLLHQCMHTDALRHGGGPNIGGVAKAFGSLLDARQQQAGKQGLQSAGNLNSASCAFWKSTCRCSASAAASCSAVSLCSRRADRSAACVHLACMQCTRVSICHELHNLRRRCREGTVRAWERPLQEGWHPCVRLCSGAIVHNVQQFV